MSTDSNFIPFRVAIVGRPNVGKSSFFNFLTRTRNAVVKNQPGVTRDIQTGTADWWGHEFEVLDTGGLTKHDDDFSALIYEQVASVLNQVDLFIFMTDAKDGIMPEDRDVYRMLLATGKPYIVVLNKVDRDQDSDVLKAEFYELGGEVFPVSVEQRNRTDEVVEKILSYIPAQRKQAEPTIRIAIAGKPNAGKSSICNAIFGEKRVLVSPVAGTTVDAIEQVFEYEGQKFTFIDTAGLRRTSKRYRRDDGVEILSSFKSQDAIRSADIVLLVIDAQIGPAEQDAKIAAEAMEHAKPIVIIANKLDLASESHNDYRAWFRDRLQFVFHFNDDLNVIFTSAKTGTGIQELLRTILKIHEQMHRKISTSKLNNFFYEVTRQAPSPVFGTTNVKFYYLTQTEQKPPAFIAFANHPEGVTPAYRRFLISRLKSHFDLQGLPVRVFVMKSGK